MARSLRCLAFLLALFIPGQAYSGTKLDVTIIERKESSSTYTYQVQQFNSSTSDSTFKCTMNGSTADCKGTAQTVGTNSPQQSVSYEVRGATLSLKLPDGRIAVVNCDYKFNWAAVGDDNYRSCRVPVVDRIQVEFSGSKAKLSWPVSIDGKKMQRETYAIIAILDKETASPTSGSRREKQ